MYVYMYIYKVMYVVGLNKSMVLCCRPGFESMLFLKVNIQIFAYIEEVYNKRTM